VIAGSIAVEEALLVLKVAFLVLLYLFIWRIVRTAARDVTLPQESFVLAPGSVPGLGDAGPHVEAGKLTVLTSPALGEGEEWELDSSPLTMGRGSQNDVQLDADEYASSTHAHRATQARRLGRGHRLDERDVPERHPADAAEAADAGRHPARRRDRAEVRP